jgi:hypothetical protein
MAAKLQNPPEEKAKELDLDRDAWPRCEELIRNAAKAGHKPHSTKTVTAIKLR